MISHDFRSARSPSPLARPWQGEQMAESARATADESRWEKGFVALGRLENAWPSGYRDGQPCEQRMLRRKARSVTAAHLAAVRVHPAFTSAR
ncbi:hypothetical protein VTK73DRAFT_1292 [Phialemonium thermophilum]|uniref:Uncharacterized protein n=1 Tax=Phialemonium thermophilum TaxID=223376 RepID=A0ABR3VTP2_9PEZI